MTAPQHAAGWDTPEGRASLARAQSPEFTRWGQMVMATGGCARPIRMTGHKHTYDPETGEVIEIYDTAEEPTGYLLISCGNRRATRCPACSEVYQGDAFQLISAGLSGGKGVPANVGSHPRLFATFTAPSFGRVHGRRLDGDEPLPCRPRSDAICPHGRAEGCLTRHAEDDPQLGTPICPDCYDYAAAVLWNAHVGHLWRRVRTYTVRELAKAAGCSRASFARQARLSYAKVAEYQKRGLVHFHAIIRIDGPGGPEDPPPAWATTALLEQAIRQAAVQVTVDVPHPHQPGELLPLRWGDQLDIRPVIIADHAETAGMTDSKAAGYIAKYATKGADVAGAVDRRIRTADVAERLNIPEHARRMITTCWELAERPEYHGLRLDAWSHMLGYPGHFLTKSRAYSVTMTALREARTEHQAAARRQHDGTPHPEPTRPVAIDSEWTYAGTGHRHGEATWARMISRYVHQRRKAAQARTDRDSPS